MNSGGRFFDADSDDVLNNRHEAEKHDNGGTRDANECCHEIIIPSNLTTQPKLRHDADKEFPPCPPYRMPLIVR